MYHKHQLSTYKWNIKIAAAVAICSSYAYIFTLDVGEIPSNNVAYPEKFYPKSYST